MRLIGAGHGRTGTRSIKEALEQIGLGPCYHMHELFEHPDHADFWLGAAGGEPVDWKGFFARYQATVDHPGAPFYKDLMEVYPEALVLLSVRDPESWYTSCMNTIYPASAREAGSEWATSDEPVAEVINAIVWDGFFEGRFTDKTRAIQLFEEHNETVQREVPPDKLLVYRVQEGWEPLCNFLGVPIPDTPFPRLNTTEEWRRGPEA